MNIFQFKHFVSSIDDIRHHKLLDDILSTPVLITSGTLAFSIIAEVLAKFNGHIIVASSLAFRINFFYCSGFVHNAIATTACSELQKHFKAIIFAGFSAQAVCPFCVSPRCGQRIIRVNKKANCDNETNVNYCKNGI
jgi:hypothetical protein